ncbi:MAG: hypothetical protein WBC44_19655, partial [Planctomycetaceae bacterium]
WDANPQVIDNALAAGSRHGLIATLVDDFIAGPDHYLAAAADKGRWLRTAPGPRIILVGGSNVAFSMDCKILEDRYGLAPVNMGLQARLGPRFMTRQVVDQVREGDVVIVMMEHLAMYRGPDGAMSARVEFGRVCPELVQYFDPEQEPPSLFRTALPRWISAKAYADHHALADLAANTRSNVEILWFGASDGAPAADLTNMNDAVAEAQKAEQARRDAEFSRRVRPLLTAAQERFVARDRVYLRSGFNRYGDMTRHLVETPYDPRHIRDFPTDFGPGADSSIRHSIALLNAFANRCRDAGAAIYFGHPPLRRSRETEGFAVEYETILEKQLDIPILFPIENSFVGVDDLYDTNSHLNWHGITKRMTVLCNGLDRHLTPQIDLSVAEQIAARDRAVRRTIVAANPEAAARLH